MADGKQEAVAVEKAEAEGSSDEDEGALVIDEKNERGGAKRKAGESTEVNFHRAIWSGAFTSEAKDNHIMQSSWVATNNFKCCLTK